MKNLRLILFSAWLVSLWLLLTCCNEQEVNPSNLLTNCTAIQAARTVAYTNWQVILEEGLNVGNLEDLKLWQVRERDAKGVYVELEKFCASNCYVKQ